MRAGGGQETESFSRLLTSRPPSLLLFPQENMRVLLGLLCVIAPLLSLETGESAVSSTLVISRLGRVRVSETFSFPFSVTPRILLAPELSI